MPVPAEVGIDRALPEPRVLIVDDDAAVAKALARLLTLEGFCMSTVHDGREALERLGAGSYDVMLLDLQMANLDGMEVFERAQRCASPPATILHSAFLDVQTAVRALRAGVSDVLQKPVPERMLAARIRELTAQRRASGREAATRAPQSAASPLDRLVGDSGPMRAVSEQIRRIARFPRLSVLVKGATGTGKELVAEAIHSLTSPGAPFVSLNCAAVSEHLFESEMFGHEAGAFTNARGSRAGLLEEAGGGTIFLDEVGEMPLDLQAKLLRVLETRRFRRVGSNHERTFDARVVSATNRPLTGAAGERLRPDLYFRLAGYTIRTPELVDHLSDLPSLAAHLCRGFALLYQLPEPEVSAEALQRLAAHRWLGNVRELRSVMERATILASGGTIGVEAVEQALGQGAAGGDSSPPPPSAELASLEAALGVVSTRRVPGRPREAAPHRSGEYVSLPDLQRQMTLQAFEDAGKNLSIAARGLGIPRSTLRRRLQKYGAQFGASRNATSASPDETPKPRSVRAGTRNPR